MSDLFKYICENDDWCGKLCGKKYGNALYKYKNYDRIKLDVIEVEVKKYYDDCCNDIKFMIDEGNYMDNVRLSKADIFNCSFMHDDGEYTVNFNGDNVYYMKELGLDYIKIQLYPDYYGYNIYIHKRFKYGCYINTINGKVKINTIKNIL